MSYLTLDFDLNISAGKNRGCYNNGNIIRQDNDPQATISKKGTIQKFSTPLSEFPPLKRSKWLI